MIAPSCPPIDRPSAAGKGARPARRRWVLVPLAVLAAVVLLAGCAAAGDGSGTAATSRAGSGAGSNASTTRVTIGSIVPHTGPRDQLDGFGEVTVTVVDAQGVTRTFCLLLADTDALRERGLMFVEDPALGGYDGMFFFYEQDDRNGYWMKNTRLPLSIAYLAADGSTVSMTDMAPCPDDAGSCPTYPAGGPYRYTIEVPEGGFDRLGISAGSKVTVGARACAPL